MSGEPELLQATYDPSGRSPGRIRISVDGQPLGDTPTRSEDQGLQFLQVDTRSHAGATTRLRFEIEGAPLHCFDLHIVP